MKLGAFDYYAKTDEEDRIVGGVLRAIRMGLGGATTCLGVKIKVAPCHLASLPLAVNIQCHSARHKEVTL